MTSDALVADGARRTGRLPARPTRVNPLDAYSGLGRRLRRLRLKEWVGFTLLSPEFASSMILQDAGYLASSEIYVRSLRTGTLTQHARNARAGSLRLAERLYGSRPEIAHPGYRIAYEWGAEGGEHRVTVDVDASASDAPIRMSLVLHGAAASAPLSVSSPLPGGAMYTHKAAFPVSGVVEAGAERFELDPARDLALLDEHRTFLPYRTSWTWGTFAQALPAGIVGANFAARPSVDGAEEESGLWVPGAVEPLEGITFDRSSDADLATWRMTSADGRLDVTFTPEGHKSVRHQLVLAAIDYHQWFGTYTGLVRSTDGPAYEIREARGVCETMRARL
ncbi:MAG: DUF2804 domain-containing protein [Nocardioides sp.]|nr:DUF2804 domain-containing protein [Nocardioides sp.]